MSEYVIRSAGETWGHTGMPIHGPVTQHAEDQRGHPLKGNQFPLYTQHF